MKSKKQVSSDIDDEDEIIREVPEMNHRLKDLTKIVSVLHPKTMTK